MVGLNFFREKLSPDEGFGHGYGVAVFPATRRRGRPALHRNDVDTNAEGQTESILAAGGRLGRQSLI